MNYKKVIIKQVADSNSAAMGLENYNRSRFPGTSEAVQVAQYPDGRFLTGLTEELEQSIGKKINQDLTNTSSFWERFIVSLSADQDTVLNSDNPYDVLKYHALVANGYVAPSKAEASHPQYLSAKYYCHVDEVEEEKNNSNRKLTDKARASLYSIEQNKELLFLIGTYLEGARYKKNMKPDTLYGMLADYIEDKKNLDNPETFLKAISLPVEDLQYKVTVETAIRKKIVKFKEGQYYRGGVNLGRTVLDVLENLKTPEFANEFIQIHTEVNNER